MELFILGSSMPVVTGIIALLIGRTRVAAWLAAFGVWIGCGMALVPVVATLSGQAVKPIQVAWSMPGGSLSFGLDGLSAFFCLPILLIAPLAALYGCAYLAHEEKSLGPILLFYNVLTTSMLLLMASRNALLFLIIWEIMAISSFFLVVFDHERAHVRDAGWTYLIATHMGTAALLVLFALLGRQADSLNFDRMGGASLSPVMASVLFALAVIWIRLKGGLHSSARLAAGGSPRGPKPRVGPDVGCDDQDRHLRVAARSDAAWQPVSGLGVDFDHHRPRVGNSRRGFRTGPT